MKIIAEIGQQHDGSLIDAFAYVRAVHAAGADAVKFQCHVPEFESSCDEQFREGTFHPEDVNRFAYWHRTGFRAHEWQALSRYAREWGLEFGASVFCSQAVGLMRDLVDFWKVPSGEWDNQLLHQELAHTDQPIYLSLGMSPGAWYSHGSLCIPDEVLEVLDLGRITPMWCVSEYPCPPEALDLRVVGPGCGLSDHSGSNVPALLAAFKSAPAAEVHVCWHKSQLQPDTASAITVDQLGNLVHAVRWVERLGACPEPDQRRAERHLAYRVGRRRC